MTQALISLLECRVSLYSLKPGVMVWLLSSQEQAKKMGRKPPNFTADNTDYTDLHGSEAPDRGDPLIG
jgi:hypothetical protein